jgi:hypothetical protein
MRIFENCKSCSEPIFLDIDSLGFSVPSDLEQIDLKKEFGDLDQEQLNKMDKIITDICKAKGMKRIHLFKECSKCGAQNTFVFFVLQN